MCSICRQQFYEVLADHAAYPNQWFLDQPITATEAEIDAREFVEGMPYHGPRPMAIPVGNPGKELAFNLGAFDMPVVSKVIVETVSRIAPADVEFYAVNIPAAKGSYSILNAIVSLDCLDEERSDFTRWTEADERPDRLGQYHVISTIWIDPSRTQGHHIFRIKDWPIALFVSGEIKEALKAIPDLGIVFSPAS